MQIALEEEGKDAVFPKPPVGGWGRFSPEFHVKSCQRYPVVWGPLSYMRGAPLALSGLGGPASDTCPSKLPLTLALTCAVIIFHLSF